MFTLSICKNNNTFIGGLLRLGLKKAKINREAIFKAAELGSDCLRISPPLVIKEEEIERACEVVVRACK